VFSQSKSVPISNLANELVSSISNVNAVYICSWHNLFPFWLKNLLFIEGRAWHFVSFVFTYSLIKSGFEFCSGSHVFSPCYFVKNLLRLFLLSFTSFLCSPQNMFLLVQFLILILFVSFGASSSCFDGLFVCHRTRGPLRAQKGRSSKNLNLPRYSSNLRLP